MATFFWTAPQNLDHSVTLAQWAQGLLVPSAVRPTVYSYTAGASGLTVLTVGVVAGMNVGFSGSAEDNAGGAWLVGYDGDVSFVSSQGVTSTYAPPSSASGDIFIDAAFCQGNPYFAAHSGDLYTVEGSITAVSPGFGETVCSLTSGLGKLFAVLPESGNLATYTLSSQTAGSVAKSKVPMDVATFAVACAASGYVVVGGYDYSTLVSGAAAFSLNPSSSLIATANTAANKIFLIQGEEPNWAIASAVSGTGAPVDLVWASTGEQVLVADTAHSSVEVFSLVTGALSYAQVLGVSGVARLAATPDGMTVLAAQTSQDIVSVLSNQANIWSATSTISVRNPSSILPLSNTEFVIGAFEELAWAQQGNNGWIITTTLSGLAFTPSSIATDGNGTYFACGSNGSTGYLVTASQSGILATATWTGSGDAVHFEQAQIAVADSTNSLIRVFDHQGSTLTQRGSFAGPTGVSAFGATMPSVWACGSSSMWQMAFTAPFTMARQPQGKIALFNTASGGSWLNADIDVLNPPTAAAWDVSGTFWVATEQDMLYRYTLGLSQASGISIPTYAGYTTVPIAISDMAWWSGGLFGVSSMNAALIEVSGSAVAGPPGVTPGAILGVNFVLGESSYQ